MNEQLQQALAVLIEKSISGIDASVNFMQAEIPEVIEQLLAWHAVKSVIFFFVFLSIAIIFPFLGIMVRSASVRALEEGDNWTKYDGCGGITSILYDFTVRVWFSSVVVTPLFVVFSANSLDWLQIWIAPKVWLIEYASKIAS